MEGKGQELMPFIVQSKVCVFTGAGGNFCAGFGASHVCGNGVELTPGCVL